MKKICTLFLLLTTLAVQSQETVTIDAGRVLRTLSGNENGINLDYLMDGNYLNPAISTSQSLKNIKVKLLRYPGGEKSDNYLFSAAPYTSASPRMALLDTCFWPSNDARFVDTGSAERLCRPIVLDFDEYIAVCNDVGASPLVVVAYDAIYNTRACTGKPTKAQLLANAVEWVRYANIKKGYGVKYWMIGNESWNNPDYNGSVSAAKYADDLDDFATAMKAVDPTIKIIANGKSGWWQTILQSSAVAKIDFLGLSEYAVMNYTGGYNYYVQNDVDLTHEVDLAIADIETYAAVPHKTRIKVIATEYNSIDWGNAWPSVNNLGHALVNFQTFGDLVVKPKLEAACMWNTRWVENAVNPQELFDAFDSQGNQNAVALSIDAWGSSLLSKMVSATNDAGAVKSYASYDDDDKRLNIFLLNKDYSAQQVNVVINNYVNDFKGAVWQLHGASVDDRFPEFARMDSIFEPADITSLTLPANSVTILKLQRDDVTLPVSLDSFKAEKKQNSVALNWETANEKNIAEYIVERSTDGTNFSPIGTVAATNNDSSVYTFDDANISNATVLYYRLIVVQANGDRVSSRVVAVTVNFIIQLKAVQPNPFDSNLLIRVSSQVEKMVSFKMVDITGRTVFTHHKPVYRGTNVIELNNLGRLMSGLYIIKMSDGSSVTTFKAVKR